MNKIINDKKRLDKSSDLDLLIDFYNQCVTEGFLSEQEFEVYQLVRNTFLKFLDEIKIK